MATITYKNFHEFPGWRLAPDYLVSLIERYAVKSVFEAGSGANPTLPVSEVVARGLDYTTSDISDTELAKADAAFGRVVLDLCAETVPDHLLGRYDLVWSRMVNEHIADPRRYYRNIHSMLRPGGVMAHCFATMYTLPFVVNRLLPDRVTDALLRLADPFRDMDQHDKFTAYYRWCRGPTPGMLANIAGLGFEVLEYTGFFGHGYYDDRKVLLPFQVLERIKTRALLQRPSSHLTSYACFVARRLA